MCTVYIVRFVVVCFTCFQPIGVYNVKHTVHCVRIYLSQLKNFCPGFEDMEPSKKCIYILKHESRKLAKFLIKGCDSRKNCYMIMCNVSSRVLLHTPTDRCCF